jgi:hypothetical protein
MSQSLAPAWRRLAGATVLAVLLVLAALAAGAQEPTEEPPALPTAEPGPTAEPDPTAEPGATAEPSPTVEETAPPVVPVPGAAEEGGPPAVLVVLTAAGLVAVAAGAGWMFSRREA